MTYNLIIKSPLLTLNEYINIERTNKYAAATVKKDQQKLISIFINSCLKNVKIEKPVILNYKWYVENKKKDKDNISFAQKFVQDSLVSCGILPNDGWNNIIGFNHNFYIDSKNPRVEVEIIEQ